VSCRRVSACLQKFEKIPPVCGLKGRGWCTLGPPERGGAAYLGVFVVRPLVLADLGVHLVAPARTAARSCRWAFPQRRRPSGCRAWPAGGPMEIRFVSASEYELRHVVWQTRSARRTGIVGGRTWSWVRTTSSASVHGAPLASTGSAIHSKGVLSQRGRRRWVMKENTCVLDWRLFSTLHLPVWRITEELAHRKT
jgi:hypothetical protein